MEYAGFENEDGSPIVPGGTTTTLYDPIESTFYFLQSASLRYGPKNQGWLPLTGDWNGDGFDNIGLYDPVDGVYHLAGIEPFRYGPKNSKWLPVAGN